MKRVDWQMTGISIEEDKVDDYYGFELEGDGLFLLEDMTVTHNSSWMRYEFYQAARKHGRSVGILNYENDPLEYARYFLAIETAIDSKKIRRPSLLSEREKGRIREAAQTLSRLPIRVVTTERNVNAAIAKARKMVVQDKITLLGVDYVQLLNNGIENRVNDVSMTTGRLRAFALDYHVPVIANAQLSRDIERRGEASEPRLDDLRESGSLEQDATLVMFPRPVRNPSVSVLEMFPENFDEASGQLLNTRPRAVPVIFHVLKNRNGTTGVSDPVKWCKHLDTYQTLSRESTAGRR
jgi:replicative DNA helicase